VLQLVEPLNISPNIIVIRFPVMRNIYSKYFLPVSARTWQ